MRHSRAYDLAMRGLKRCDKPAQWEARGSGYRTCSEHVHMLDSAPNQWADLLSEQGPGPWGKCDYCVDGMGAASWPERLAAAKKLTGEA